MTHQSTYTARIICVMALLFAGFAAMAVHLYRVQILRHEELFEKAKEKYTTSKTERGVRGIIYDTHGNVLAGNFACRDVMAEPRLFGKNMDFLLGYLSRQLDMSRHELQQKMAPGLRAEKPQVEMVLAHGVDITRTEKMRAVLEKRRIHGVRFVDSTRRYYPKKTLVSNLLGFVDNEGKGIAGVEKAQDTIMQPTTVSNRFERDRRGTQLEYDQNQVELRPRDGGNIYLTIDEIIQQIVEEELNVLMEKHAPRAAFAVMANPKNGAIMAWAQRPTFDPNNRKSMDPEAWQNRILVEGFEPGSTMKAISLTGALDAGVVTLDTIIDCEDGKWMYCNRFLRDAGHSMGRLQVRQVVQKSSNIGTAKIALMLGPQKMYDNLVRFGIGQRTGIGFGEESPGIFRKLSRWDGLSITRVPIGQGVLTTPLQMVQAYCALANHGKMYRLSIIDRVETSEDAMPKRVEPVFVRQVAGEAAVQKMVEALKLVTQEGGTAPNARVEGYEAAGKTGTAQKVVNGQYANNKHVASFVGFIPADAPAFVLLIAADEPTKNGYYGGTVTAPAFSHISEKTLRYLEIAPAKSNLPPAPRAEPLTEEEQALKDQDADIERDAPDAADVTVRP